ncbi:hypothetical protein LARI1_G006256 [Lachnellula arida]|uniref:Small secreted protein n=1 Tax=Lachnellula arida TaxID=1316785 RepID=A0A8T9B8Y8_9HELO|nr:hypothetical protein LARI1_G006256 [Lachnellula arida]
MYCTALAVFAVIVIATVTVQASPTSFNLSAITAINNTSVIQCWQLTEPLVTSSVPGIVGAAAQQLGSLANASYGFLPAHFVGTPHPAPAVQYVVFLSGQTQITIPNSTQQAIFKGGTNGIIIAADTADKSAFGHVSTTLNGSVAALQIPTRKGKIPCKRVLYNGACKASELNF